MKFLMALFVFLTCSFTSSAHDTTVLPGRVYAGAELLCKVSNHTQDDLLITRYRYRIYQVNAWGSREWVTLNYSCGFRCELDAGDQVFLTGPLNQRNFLQAQCWALAVDQDHHDDTPGEPEVF